MFRFPACHGPASQLYCHQTFLHHTINLLLFQRKKYLQNTQSYDRIINVAKIGRHVGMADEADSKSVDGNIVWVQVPLPALFFQKCKVLKVAFLRYFSGFLLFGNIDSMCYKSITSANSPERKPA